MQGLLFRLINCTLILPNSETLFPCSSQPIILDLPWQVAKIPTIREWSPKKKVVRWETLTGQSTRYNFIISRIQSVSIIIATQKLKATKCIIIWGSTNMIIRTWQQAQLKEQKLFWVVERHHRVAMLMEHMATAVTVLLKVLVCST